MRLLQVLAILVAVFDEAERNNEIKFLELLPVHDCTAEGIFTAIDVYFRYPSNISIAAKYLFYTRKFYVHICV